MIEGERRDVDAKINSKDRGEDLNRPNGRETADQSKQRMM